MSHYKVISCHDEELLMTAVDLLELLAPNLSIRHGIYRIEVFSEEGSEKDNVTYHLDKMGLHFLHKGVNI